MEAVILAGGLGKRLRSVVADVPKPMAPVLGRPFLEHQMDYWIGQGVTRFILSIGYKREIIQSHFGDRYRGADVSYAVEETPLGTGGGLLLSTRLLKAPGSFLLLNGDTFFQVPMKGFSDFHRRRSAALTVAVIEVARNDRYSGIVLKDDGAIAEFKASRGDGGRTFINGGVYLLERDAVSTFPWDGRSPASFEEGLVPAIQASGRRLQGFPCAAPFIDIGVPESYKAAGEIVADR